MTKAIKGYKVLKVTLVIPEHKVLKDRKVMLVLTGHKVHKVMLDLKV